MNREHSFTRQIKTLLFLLIKIKVRIIDYSRINDDIHYSVSSRNTSELSHVFR